MAFCGIKIILIIEYIQSGRALKNFILILNIFWNIYG